jgi:hypothetical protein
MRKCTDCGGMVSDSVSRCPHCGKVDNPFHVPNWAIVAGLLGLGALYLLYAQFGG